MERDGYVVIGVIGSRSRDDMEDQDKVFKAIKKVWVKDKSIICSGGAMKGGDRFAKLIAFMHQLPYLEFPAEWDRKGKSAGFIRNQTIAEWCDILIACRAEDGSHGTDHTIKQFKELGKGDNLIIV